MFIRIIDKKSKRMIIYDNKNSNGNDNMVNWCNMRKWLKVKDGNDV